MSLDKASLSERDICTKLILPALEQAGWDRQSQLFEEYPLRAGGVIERELALPEFPSPVELWSRFTAWKGLPADTAPLLAQDYHPGKRPRYYQLNAINRVVEAVASRQRRLLLVMATGTGKTFTAFQIIWRLWKGKAVKRVMFLADRSINSMTEFKQIIGRGTRINEDYGKLWFSILDFKRATELFADPAFASAPEGFKRLRELVLNLAVRGRLVPQDPKDEPAERLLDRIRKERATLPLKREKALEPIADDDVPYDLPHSWRWVRLPEICHDWGQKVPSGPFTYVDVGAIDNERGVITDDVRRLDESNAPSRARKIVRAGTVLYSTVRPYLLNVAVVERAFKPEPIASTAFAVLHPLQGINGRFLFHYLRSQPFIDFVASKMVGVAYPAINDSNFFSGLFPLPPIAEQSRIVAKVEELLALIDALEAKVGAGETAHGKLLDALLAALADSPDAAATAEAWAQLAPHLDLLLQTPADVDRLHQTLLQLAVKGRLVPQDHKDEPAVKGKPSPALGDDEEPFALPSGWEWVRVSDICSVVTDGEHATPKRTEDRNAVPLVTAKNVRDGEMDYAVTDFVPIEVAQKCWRRCKPQESDILMVSVGATLGRLTVLHPAKDMVIVRSVTVLRPIQSVVSPDYLALHLRSPGSQTEIWSVVRQSAQPCLYLAKSAALKIALPPLPEQSRIVAAVASFTALCDRLRERLAARRELSAKLAPALTESALA